MAGHAEVVVPGSRAIVPSRVGVDKIPGCRLDGPAACAAAILREERVLDEFRAGRRR